MVTGLQFAHPLGWLSSVGPTWAVAGVANGSNKVAAADRSAMRAYLISSNSDKRNMGHRWGGGRPRHVFLNTFRIGGAALRLVKRDQKWP